MLEFVGLYYLGFIILGPVIAIVDYIVFSIKISNANEKIYLLTDKVKFLESCLIENKLMLKPYSKELKTEAVIKVKYIAIPDTETDAKCPNCDSLINSKKIKCWKCQASFDTDSSWKPIKI